MSQGSFVYFFPPSPSASFARSSYSLCRVFCICTYFVSRRHRRMILPHSMSQWELARNVYRVWVFRAERLNWLTIKISSTSTLSLTRSFTRLFVGSLTGSIYRFSVPLLPFSIIFYKRFSFITQQQTNDVVHNYVSIVSLKSAMYIRIYWLHMVWSERIKYSSNEISLSNSISLADSERLFMQTFRLKFIIS